MRMRHSLVWLVGLVGLTAAGCVDRGAPGGGNGNNSNSNQNGNQNNNTNNNNNETGCHSPDDCVVALKYDVCCACPRPASQADMAADPCLLPLGAENIPEQCMVECPAMPCEQCLNQGKTVTCRDGNCEWFEGHCDRDEDCVVGIRTDNCCTAAMPVNKTDIEQDQCLDYWPLEYGFVPQACLDKWDPECATIDCAPMDPWSRAVACRDDGEGKMCTFVPECNSSTDCEVLIDTKSCCPCAEPWPASMKNHDPCLVAPGEPVPSGCAPTVCPDVPCQECPAVDAECQDHKCVSLVWETNGDSGR